MHKHVEWDDPGADSVQRYFADKPDEYPTAHVGSIIAGRYHGYSVRVRVEARVDDDTASIGDVVALSSELALVTVSGDVEGVCGGHGERSFLRRGRVVGGTAPQDQREQRSSGSSEHRGRAVVLESTPMTMVCLREEDCE